MASNHEQQSDLREAPTCDDEPTPWTTLELPIPNERNTLAINRFVECALIELRNAPVGAEYVSSHRWGAKHTQYFAVDGHPGQFRKRYFDIRLGWDKTVIRRDAVRDELIGRLTNTGSISTALDPETLGGARDRFHVERVEYPKPLDRI